MPHHLNSIFIIIIIMYKGNSDIKREMLLLYHEKLILTIENYKVNTETTTILLHC